MESSYVLDSRLRGNDTLGFARPGNGRLLPSAKMLLKLLIFADRRDSQNRLFSSYLKGFLGFANINRNLRKILKI